MNDRELAAALTGDWILERWTIRYPDTGRITEPFGPEPQGLLMYSADGHMSAAMQRPGRPRLSNADPRAVGDAEKAAAFGSYLHYAGRWTVRDGCVVHEVALAMNPDLLGTRQLRSVGLDGDRLVLGADEALGGGRSRVHSIHWRRASGAAG